MSRITKILILLLLITMLLVACGGDEDIEPSPLPPAESVATAAPTATPVPPEPTDSPAPTATPTPPTPTEAVEPTPTAVAAEAQSPLETPTPEFTPEIVWADLETKAGSGLYERGDPEASLVILDYSDFL